MNIIDIAILCFLLFYAYRGYMQGFIIVFFSLFSILFSLYVAFILYNDLSSLLLKIISGSSLAKLVSFVLIFVIVNYGINKLGDYIQNILDKLYLSVVNRLLGSVINFFKAILFVSILLYALSGFSYNPTFNSILKDSRLSNIFLGALNNLVVELRQNIPSEIKEQWFFYEKKLKEFLE